MVFRKSEATYMMYSGIPPPPSPLHKKIQPVRRMRCTPLSVSTILLMVPTCNEKVASSNGFCIWPRPNQPRSPLLACEEQSECV